MAWLDRAGWLVDNTVTVLGLLGERAGLEHDEPGTNDEMARLVHADATAALEQLVQPLAADEVSLDFILRGGHPLQATFDVIEELRVDLVAVARPLRRPGRNPFAEKIARHSPASVLLVPTA
ncbi:MAG: universal stress protein [Chloroflexota bacterium]